MIAKLRVELRALGWRRGVALLLAVVVLGGAAGVGLRELVVFVADRAVMRPQVVDVVSTWSADQRTVQPLIPCTRPVQINAEGNPAEVCRLSGWPSDPCAQTGLQPRLAYCTAPQLVDVALDDQGYVAVLSYTDATDQQTPRWVGVTVAHRDGLSWFVDRFADLPFSGTPSTADARRLLSNVNRCDPRS